MKATTDTRHIPHRASALLAAASCIRHGFYGRQGGVSGGEFASLNCAADCGDRPDAVAANRRLVAGDLGVARICLNRQVHSARTRIIAAADLVDSDTADTMDSADSIPADPDTDLAHPLLPADALVTRETGVALGVLTADCAPVLLVDPVAGVIGAAHAGWRGALLGVVEAVVEGMVALGGRPNRMVAAVGPAIQCRSYSVGGEFHAHFRAESPVPCATCFQRHGDGYRFDLPHYVRLRLARTGVPERAIEVLADDTFADETLFSHRRSRLRGEAGGGRQLAAIALAEVGTETGVETETEAGVET